jgi:hyperosmotically inducible periplasmic protein
MKKYLSQLALVITMTVLPFINTPLYASEIDDRIESTAKESYVFRTFLKGDDITVQSKDGVATLSGTVSDKASKSLAEETVRNLPGVTSVDNRLIEKPEDTAANLDAWIVTKVQSTLLLHRNADTSETEVDVKDGVVTLRGQAGSSAQMDLATEYAKDVEGVKDVKNEMMVSTGKVSSGKQTMSQRIAAIGEKVDDASITGLVKMTLLYHRSTSAVNTHVETNNGQVNLGGIAKNAAEKDLVTQLVSDVYGVEVVVNNMNIETVAPTIK